MLNISHNSINHILKRDQLKSFDTLTDFHLKKRTKLFFIILFISAIVFLFLPWNQNISSAGKVTTLLPEQRPQNIQTIIAGRITDWYVKEGDFVKLGDTIAYITEVKSEYFDPGLVGRTQEQVSAKEQSVSSYQNKVQALENQYSALQQVQVAKIKELQNKIQQTQYKIQAAEAELIAYQNDVQIANNQLNRTQELYDKGIKSLSDLEQKRLKQQETTAKLTAQQNKILSLRNEAANYQVEISRTQSEYADKMAKAQSDKFTAETGKWDASASTSKLKNELNNYSVRQQFYYITAPQSGYITEAIKKGKGEIVKEGESIVTIMPEQYDLALEMYVKPIDLPLLSVGNSVRMQFDGWPAIVFSGWPNASFGTFTGEIMAIDRFQNAEGKYRVLVIPKEGEKPWPKNIRMGVGAQSFILLKKVPVWYELWRQLNGFPADFYGIEEKEDTKSKAPLKSVK